MIKGKEISGARPDESNQLNKTLNSVGLKLEGVSPKVKIMVPQTLSRDVLAATAFAMSEDVEFGQELAERVVGLRRDAIQTLKMNRSYTLDLNIPGLRNTNYEPTAEDLAPSILAASLGSFAMTRVAMPNKDPKRTITQLYAATTPRTNLVEGELQLSYIGVKTEVIKGQPQHGWKWEAPPQIDPLQPDLLSPRDLLVYLSGSNQLGLVGDHETGKGIKVSDPRHLINLLHGLANPGLSGHWADSLEANGKRGLLTETSTNKIIAPNEFGDSLFQDPLKTTDVVTIGAERIMMGVVLAPELMVDIDTLEPMRANEAGSLEILQGMALAARFQQRLGDRLERALPTSGLI